MKNDFVESPVVTKFGSFVFRVYAAAKGNETVVLRTANVDATRPFLVRVHSECMTGDAFGSLRCDCGEQLAAALKRISESGNGALIYLRQEGRGIGLYEKIRAYQLQDQGLDTFEANIKLGHPADARTYEMAKTALDDLGVTRVRLLTNNPSKASDLMKFGIDVAEIVPIIIAPNGQNDRYLASKRDRFESGLA